MRRTALTLTAMAAALTLTIPAVASDLPVGAWGFTGSLLTPTADVLEYQQARAAAGFITGGGRNQVYGSYHMGLLQGLEVGLTYNAPGAPVTLAGDLKARLIRQTEAVPFSLAIGGMQLGGNATDGLGLNNQLYMLLGHNLTWSIEGKPVILARLAAGFGTNFSLSQPMASLHVPLLGIGGLDGEFVGGRGSTGAMINVGASLAPFPWLGLKVASLGPLDDLAARAWLATASLKWTFPANGNLLDPKEGPPTPQRTPAPSVSPPPISHTPSASPKPVASAAPASTATATPSPAWPEGLLRGKVTHDGKGVDKVQLQLVGSRTWTAWSSADGSYKFPLVPQGVYRLKVDPMATTPRWKPVDKEVTVIGGAAEVNLALTALPATLKGTVKAGEKGISGITVAIESLGIATLSKDDGKYTLEEIPAGTYQITYTQKRKTLDKVTLTLGQGETVARNFTLNPSDAPPPPARAILRGEITDAGKGKLSGARLQLEGKDVTVMDMSRPDGSFVLRDLPAGSYKLTVSKKGFISRSFALTLKAGQESRHAIALTPAGK